MPPPPKQETPKAIILHQQVIKPASPPVEESLTPPLLPNMLVAAQPQAVDDKMEKEGKKRNNWDMFADEAPGKAEVNVSYQFLSS